jgi:hypothetical protein
LNTNRANTLDFVLPVQTFQIFALFFFPINQLHFVHPAKHFHFQACCESFVDRSRANVGASKGRRWLSGNRLCGLCWLQVVQLRKFNQLVKVLIASHLDSRDMEMFQSGG